MPLQLTRGAVDFDLAALDIALQSCVVGLFMKVAGHRWMPFCAVVVSLLAACMPKDQGGLNAPADYPADHWVNVGQVAIVASRDGHAYLTASCYYGATVALMSTAEVTDQPEARILALGFDGSAPVSQKWASRAYAPPRWGFETGESQSEDFSETLARLREYREAEAVVQEAGREVLHVHFSLAGAGAALAKAFTNCPP